MIVLNVREKHEGYRKLIRTLSKVIQIDYGGFSLISHNENDRKEITREPRKKW